MKLIGKITGIIFLCILVAIISVGATAYFVSVKADSVITKTLNDQIDKVTEVKNKYIENGQIDKAENLIDAIDEATSAANSKKFVVFRLTLKIEAFQKLITEFVNTLADSNQDSSSIVNNVKLTLLN